MASSGLCNDNSCKRTSRALCNCCQQYLCIDHLKEHSDLLNAQLNPLADRINELLQQFNSTFSLPPVFFTELDRWRQEAHQAVDRFYDKKQQEFADCIHSKRNKNQIELDRLRNQVHKLIEEQEATQEHINSINDSIRSLEEKINQHQFPQLTFSPLIVNDHLVNIKQRTSSWLHNLLPLPPPYRTMKLKDPDYSIAANDNHLLLVQDSKLCLLDQQLLFQKEIAWTHGRLFDVFWSKVLAQFILITDKQIFTLEDKTMTLQRCPMIRNITGADWYCGTDSNDSLFLSIGIEGSSIYQYSLQPSIEFIKEYRSPLSCTPDENIWDLSSNNLALALVIINRQCESRLDLCSPKTLERLWSIQFGAMSTWYRIRCCSLSNDNWMLIDLNNSALLHISADGKLVKTMSYNPSSLHAVQLGGDALVILTKENVNLYHRA